MVDDELARVTTGSALQLLVVLAAIGVLVALLPMDERIRTAIVVIAVVIALFWLIGYVF